MHRALLFRHFRGRTLGALDGVAHGRTAISRQIEPAAYIASSVSSSKQFSTASRHNVSASTSPPEKPPSSGSGALILGSAAVAAVFLAAHQAGYIELPGKSKVHKSPDLAIPGTTNQKPEDVENGVENLLIPERGEDTDLVSHEKRENVAVQGTDEEPEVTEAVITSTNHTHGSSYEGESQQKEGTSIQFSESLPDTWKQTSSEDDLLLKNKVPAQSPSQEGTSDIFKHENEASQEDLNVEVEHEAKENSQGREDESTHRSLEDSLSDDYLLQDESSKLPFPGNHNQEVEVPLHDPNKDASKDEKLVVDLIEAIHAAERKQAESDANIFSEEKRLLEEKYKRELKDAWARELMYAEEAASLNKELNKERVKSSASIKLLEEKAEEKLKVELQRKEEEAELELKKAKELAKAEIAAAIASEKSSQLEKLAEANLHINALCMAFYARSEEARQSHSVHKLVLGILALEDALAKGLPIGKEISSLQTSVDGIDRDSFLDLVLSSLPDETLKLGTYTHLQLNQKFEASKRTLQHLALIPAGGGGLLAHSLAFVASFLKVREDTESGKGIESVISQVERFLAEGRLAEAAEALELGVSGSQAEGLASEWVKLARNRAITEQALSLLQSYATAVSST
ncbi:uncharacterized protein LOC116261455 isoform X2 [Nymphaea colorata]|uniref:uncharacterized protein LOC116261455 isoform X2 n=1 Tax=Nymphaea colorata TaxID=210225 RepID=UPI00129D6DE0|nr:uncharacterized protein LOC116261455 isoform X2 [Nymphaea colorata]